MSNWLVRFNNPCVLLAWKVLFRYFGRFQIQEFPRNVQKLPKYNYPAYESALDSSFFPKNELIITIQNFHYLRQFMFGFMLISTFLVWQTQQNTLWKTDYDSILKRYFIDAFMEKSRRCLVWNGSWVSTLVFLLWANRLIGT